MATELSRPPVLVMTMLFCGIACRSSSTPAAVHSAFVSVSSETSLVAPTAVAPEDVGRARVVWTGAGDYLAASRTRYALLANGRVVVRSVHGGAVVSSTAQLVESELRTASSASLDQNRIVLALPNVLLSLDLASGRVAWREPLGAEPGALHTLADVVVATGCGASEGCSTRAFAGRDGSALWTKPGRAVARDGVRSIAVLDSGSGGWRWYRLADGASRSQVPETWSLLPQMSREPLTTMRCVSNQVASEHAIACAGGDGVELFSIHDGRRASFRGAPDEFPVDGLHVSGRSVLAVGASGVAHIFTLVDGGWRSRTVLPPVPASARLLMFFGSHALYSVGGHRLVLLDLRDVDPPASQLDCEDALELLGPRSDGMRFARRVELFGDAVARAVRECDVDGDRFAETASALDASDLNQLGRFVLHSDLPASVGHAIGQLILSRVAADRHFEAIDIGLLPLLLPQHGSDALVAELVRIDARSRLAPAVVELLVRWGRSRELQSWAAGTQAYESERWTPCDASSGLAHLCSGADQDRDGWADGVEVHLGTSPRDADSDDDGLRDGHDPCPLLAASTQPISGAMDGLIGALLSVGNHPRPLLVQASHFPHCPTGLRVPILHRPDRPGTTASPADSLRIHTERVATGENALCGYGVLGPDFFAALSSGDTHGRIDGLRQVRYYEGAVPSAASVPAWVWRCFTQLLEVDR